MPNIGSLVLWKFEPETASAHNVLAIAHIANRLAGWPGEREGLGASRESTASDDNRMPDGSPVTIPDSLPLRCIPETTSFMMEKVGFSFVSLRLESFETGVTCWVEKCGHTAHGSWRKVFGEERKRVDHHSAFNVHGPAEHQTQTNARMPISAILCGAEGSRQGTATHVGDETESLGVYSAPYQPRKAQISKARGPVGRWKRAPVYLSQVSTRRASYESQIGEDIREPEMKKRT
ncbi:hypothetical protein PM082_023236 [Marasmius tenuissimus]|nr:hypothetical protein PM082_023236 [Marasmius tenuissimus]